MSSTGNQFHDWREWRRLRALDLAHQGWRQRDIAIALDASKGAVSHWLAAARCGGMEALRCHRASGRAARLTVEQFRLIPDFLWHGAEAYGFRGDVWTCKRIAEVLHEEFNVSYSISQVSRILKRLKWTPQIPVTRAIQRDEKAIEQWRSESWPAIKEMARKESRELVFVDEAGFYLLPGVVKTYAPEGQRPILDEWQTRDHLSIMGGVTRQGSVYSFVRPTSLNGAHSIAFLDHLRRHLGDRLLVIWDGSPIHRRTAVREFVEKTGGAIQIKPLPAYAPDLNPVEWLWNQLKHVELRNLACLDLDQLQQELHFAIGRLRQRPTLIQSFFTGAGLEL